MGLKNKVRNVLHVTHCWAGGISVYVADLKWILKGDFEIFILKCENGMIKLEYGTDGEIRRHYNLSRPISMIETSDSSYRRIVRLILEAFEIDLIHINITLGHTHDIFAVAREKAIPVIYTAHDFFYICPTFHMIDRNGIYCNGCKYGNENAECLKDHPYINDLSFDKKKLKKWRSAFTKVKGLIDLYIFPSFSCKDIFTSFYDIDEGRCRVIYHGTITKKKSFLSKRTGDELKVGILGSMFKHKGESLIKYVLESIADDKIKFHHFGEGFLKGRNLVNYGAYERTKIVELLREVQIDVILLLSTWPETFSYTLTEAICAGIPPVVTNLGSLRERVEEGKIGWVVDHKNPGKLCELLRHIRADRMEIEKRREQIKVFPLKSLREMREDYLGIYKSVISRRAAKRSDPAKVMDAGRKLSKYEVKYVGEKDTEQGKRGPLEIFLSSMTKKKGGGDT